MRAEQQVEAWPVSTASGAVQPAEAKYVSGQVGFSLLNDCNGEKQNLFAVPQLNQLQIVSKIRMIYFFCFLTD